MRGICAASALILLSLVSAGPGRAELPDAAEALRAAGFSDSQAQQALAGELAHGTPKAASERELTTSLAFRLDVAPETVMGELRKGALLTADPTSLSDGPIEGAGSLAALGGLTLGAEEVAAYSAAEAGADLNLSAAELSAIGAVADGDATAMTQAVHQQLLGRHQGYRAKGLAGIAPYDRGDGETRSAADELRTATQALEGFKKYLPAFHQLMLDYPNGKPEGFEEQFHWRKLDAHGSPTIVLNHAIAVPSGDGFAAAQRQFYVNRGFNAEQSVVALIPVKAGTLVIYSNHTSTDQVAGFGGGAKRSIGSKLLASQIEELFEKFRKATDSR
jgi:hypothetical protein